MVLDDWLPEHAPVPLLQHPDHVVSGAVGLVGGRDDAVATGRKQQAGAHLAEVDEGAGASNLYRRGEGKKKIVGVCHPPYLILEKWILKRFLTERQRLGSHRCVPPHVSRVDPVVVPRAGVHLEPDVVEGLAVLLLLREGDYHRADVLAVERVGVVEVDKVLRVAGVPL